MNDYKDWREKEIQMHGDGGVLQRQAEEIVEKHYSEPFIEVCDDRSKKIKYYRRSVAETLIRRGTASKRKFYFFV